MTEEIKGKTCNDANCPTHGELSVRGHTIEGTVTSAKMNRTVLVETMFTRKIQKYKRYEKRYTRVAAHNPDCIAAKEGDKVEIQECRPLSKTKSYVVIEKKGGNTPAK